MVPFFAAFLILVSKGSILSFSHNSSITLSTAYIACGAPGAL